MATTSTSGKPASAVQRARQAMEDRIALVGAAAKRQDRIRKLLAQLDTEREAYTAEYQAALASWSRAELDDFDLEHPDQIGRAQRPTTRRQPPTKTGPRKRTARGEAEPAS